MNVFTTLLTIIRNQNTLLKNIAEKLKQLELGGGSGNASISDYEMGKTYKRNTLLVDPGSVTVYHVIPTQYVSVSVDDDKRTGYLKVVGFESEIVTFHHNPSQSEINALPDDAFVVVYSPTDVPYVPDQQ
jgi:hypothetical protein